MSAFLHIMVNYRNDLETKAFLQKCLQVKGAEKGLFVIVNNSAKSVEDSTFSNLSSFSSQIEVLNCPDNPGYFPGAQRVLKRLDIGQFQFVILSNTDLEIQTEDFYQTLNVMKPESSPIGAVAPSIRSELSQRECNPLYWNRPKKEKIHFLKNVYSSYFFAWIYHVLSFFKARFGSEAPIFSGQYAYAPHGCFLILTHNYFKAGGDFSHGVRLYGEEIVLAEKLRVLGLKVVLNPHLKISHREKGTESSWWDRATLSKRTFAFKKEAAQFLDQTFEGDVAARKSRP